jgi:hypothetical protein
MDRPRGRKPATRQHSVCVALLRGSPETESRFVAACRWGQLGDTEFLPGVMKMFGRPRRDGAHSVAVLSKHWIVQFYWQVGEFIA